MQLLDVHETRWILIQSIYELISVVTSFLLRLCFFNFDLIVILKKKKDLEMARSTRQLISQASKAVKLGKYCDCNNNALTINVNCKIL